MGRQRVRRRLGATALAIAVGIGAAAPAAEAGEKSIGGSFDAPYQRFIEWSVRATTDLSRNGKWVKVCEFPGTRITDPWFADTEWNVGQICQRFKRKRGRAKVTGLEAANRYRGGWLTEQTNLYNGGFPRADGPWFTAGVYALVAEKGISHPVVHMPEGPVPLIDAGRLGHGLRLFAAPYVFQSADHSGRRLTARKRVCRRGKCRKREVTIWHHPGMQFDRR